MIGQTGGLNYAIPQKFIGMPQEEEVSPELTGKVNLGDLEGLAYQEGLTNQYYDSYGKLKSFVEEMNNQGIDVTRPKYGDPSHQTLFNAYKKMEANLLRTSNDLQNELKFKQDYDQQVMSGNFTPSEQADPNALLSQQDVRDLGHTNKLLPEVIQAQRIADTQTYSDSDRNRLVNEVGAQIANLEQRRNQATRQSERDYLDYNIQALRNVQPRQTNPAYFRADAKPASGSGTSKGAIALREIANTAQGNWRDSDISKETDENGDPIFVNNARKGQKFGKFTYTTGSGNKRVEKSVDRIIKRWVKKPDGSVWVDFEQTEKGQTIPPEQVDNQNAGTVGSMFFSNTTSYAKALEEAENEGWVDAAGYVDYEKLPSGGYETPDISKDKTTTDKAKKEVADGVAKSTREKPFIVTINGKKIAVKPKRGWGGYYIEEDDKEIADGLSEKEVMSKLNELGYFKQVLNSKPVSTETDPDI